MWSLQQEFKLGWSSARVETFQRYPNPKEAEEVSNYRPISLLSLASEALCLQPYHIAHFHSASPSTIRLWPRKVNHLTASARSSGYSSSVGVSQPCRLTLSTLILWKHLTRLCMFFFWSNFESLELAVITLVYVWPPPKSDCAWKMDLNQTKCTVLRVIRCRRPITTTYKLLGAPLKAVRCPKGLGIFVTKDLQWNKQEDATTAKANSMLGFKPNNHQHSKC